VGLEDIRVISFECNKCKARITFSPKEFVDVPFRCHQCRSVWRNDAKSKHELANSAFVKLMESMNSILTHYEEGAVGFKVLFEFEEPRA
jgi:hypothetical protein